MQKLRTGEMLRRFRIEKEVAADKLGNGICGETSISNYEVGERDIDTILFEFFLERMGVSSEDFAFMLTEKEYAYYIWKATIYEAVEKADWDELERLLSKKEATTLVGNDKVQKQFYLYMKAILEAEKYAHYEVAAEDLLCGIELTVQDIYHISMEKQLLSVRELHMIILYLHYSLCANCIENFVAEQMFYVLEQYILDSCWNADEKTKIYPKLICIWINHQKNRLSHEEQIRMCKQAIQVLKESLQFNDILEILNIYLSLLEKDSEEYLFYKKQYQSFEELFAYAEIKDCFRPEYIIRKIPKVYVITEYLKSKRKEMKLSQERLSEGICEPENYSRIETGRRAPLPTNRRALVDKLQIGWYYYRGEVDTDSSEVFRLKRKHRVAQIKGNWQESYEILEKMETLLDMTSVMNQQYIYSEKSDALYHLGRLSEDEFFENLCNLLRLTKNVDYKGLVFYSQTELEVIGDMAKILRKWNRTEEAIEFLECILEQMSKSKVDFVYRWGGIEYIKRILGSLYFDLEEFEYSYEIENPILQMAVRKRDSGNLPTILDDLADDLEHIGEQYREEYMKLYRLTYYVCDFYGITHIRDFTKEYYEKFEEGYKWY